MTRGFLWPGAESGRRSSPAAARASLLEAQQKDRGEGNHHDGVIVEHAGNPPSALATFSGRCVARARPRVNRTHPRAHLFWRESPFPVNGSPRRRSMAAAKKFLVDGFVALAAVARGEICSDDESVVVFALLSLGGLMAVEAIHALGCVRRHFVFVHHGILKPRMALGTLARSAYEVRRWLAGLGERTIAVDEERGKNQREGDCDTNKDSANDMMRGSRGRDRARGRCRSVMNARRRPIYQKRSMCIRR